MSLAGILSTKISFLSLDIAKDFSLIPERRKIILHNPVRPASKEADVMGISKSQYVMLNVGRLVEFKDQKTLIGAFGMIADEFPNWRLKIIGQGPLRAELDRTIEGLGLSKVVEIIDKSKRIEDEYANADLFVSSSIYEGFGLVTAEASSTGLPCVGFHDAGRYQ